MLFCFPGSPSRLFFEWFSVKTIVLVGIYNQQFKGTILFLVLDFQGIYIYIHVLNVYIYRIHIYI